MPDMFEKITYPKGGPFRHYCYECSSWVRDYDRESDMKDVWNIDVAEPQGRCDGILTDKYRQACPFFVKVKKHQRRCPSCISEQPKLGVDAHLSRTNAQEARTA